MKNISENQLRSILYKVKLAESYHVPDVPGCYHVSDVSECYHVSNVPECYHVPSEVSFS